MVELVPRRLVAVQADRGHEWRKARGRRQRRMSGRGGGSVSRNTNTPTQHLPVSDAWSRLVDLRVQLVSDEAGERLAVCLVLYAWAARHSVTRNRYGGHSAGLQVLEACQECSSHRLWGHGRRELVFRKLVSGARSVLHNAFVNPIHCDIDVDQWRTSIA